MTDVVGGIAGTGVVTASLAAAAVSAKTSVSGSGSFGASLAQSSADNSAVSTLAPHVKIDPNYGLVTQYLDSSGDIISQVPSSFALTYLRAGLGTNNSGGDYGAATGGEVFA